MTRDEQTWSAPPGEPDAGHGPGRPSEHQRHAQDGSGILSVHFGHAANCSSIGSFVDFLFVSTAASAAALSAIAALLGGPREGPGNAEASSETEDDRSPGRVPTPSETEPGTPEARGAGGEPGPGPHDEGATGRDGSNQPR
jgi:hypothetical protein